MSALSAESGTLASDLYYWAGPRYLRIALCMQSSQNICIQAGAFDRLCRRLRSVEQILTRVSCLSALGRQTIIRSPL